MTDLLKAAIIKAEKEEDIEISDQLMIDWLDSLIEMQNRINAMFKDYPIELCMGTLDADKGEYTKEFSTCYFDIRKIIHIHNGIFDIAKALNKELDVERIVYADESSNEEYSFMYKGYKILQLVSDKDKAEGEV